MAQPKTHRIRDWALLGGLVVLLLAVDRASKWLVVHRLAVNEAWAPFPALAKFFTITHVQNTGVAFGQLSGLGWVFMLVNIAVLVAVLVYYPRIPAGQWLLKLAAALILAGDLGNVSDRLRSAFRLAQSTGGLWAALPRASVTDMFDFKIWPVFNVADLCLVSGIIIVALWLWRSEKARVAVESSRGAPDDRRSTTDA
jgi:signal peptidase II